MPILDTLPQALYIRTGEHFTSVRPLAVSGIRVEVRVSGQASKVARKGQIFNVNVSQLRWASRDARHNIVTSRRASQVEIVTAIVDGSWGNFPS